MLQTVLYNVLEFTQILKWKILKNTFKLYCRVSIPYSKTHNTGESRNMTDQAAMLFKPLDWTIAIIIAFDWLSVNAKTI